MNISIIKFLASRHFHHSMSSPPPLVNNPILYRPHGTAGLGPDRAPPSRLVGRRRPGPGQANLQSGSGGHDVLAVMYPTNAVIGWRGGNCIPPRRPCSPEIRARLSPQLGTLAAPAYWNCCPTVAVCSPFDAFLVYLGMLVNGLVTE